ncbi:MAG: hypothetical protein H6619_02345 [Deltaproteobacteria bacterium]|nr:hypothetical protein [Deltaproteobacteria bacterium]
MTNIRNVGRRIGQVQAEQKLVSGNESRGKGAGSKRSKIQRNGDGLANAEIATEKKQAREQLRNTKANLVYDARNRAADNAVTAQYQRRKQEVEEERVENQENIARLNEERDDQKSSNEDRRVKNQNNIREATGQKPINQVA